jgi:hypothetical protein
VLSAFYLTKSLLCNVAIYFRVFISEKCFKMFKEDFVQIPTQRSRIPSFRPDGSVMRPDAHQDSNSSRLHLDGDQRTASKDLVQVPIGPVMRA